MHNSQTYPLLINHVNIQKSLTLLITVFIINRGILPYRPIVDNVLGRPYEGAEEHFLVE